jgi:hypothetical protein
MPIYERDIYISEIYFLTQNHLDSSIVSEMRSQKFITMEYTSHVYPPDKQRLIGDQPISIFLIFVDVRKIRNK